MPRLNQTTDAVTDWHFPKAGIDQAGPYGRQPVRKGRDGTYVRTCASAVNVRGYEPVGGRDRGGARCGLVKYNPDRVGTTSFVVQDLRLLSTTTPPATIVPLSLSGRAVLLIAVSQGVVKVMQSGDTAWTATNNASSTTPPLNFSGVMMSAANLQKMFFVDGTHYRYYAPQANTVHDWTPTAGALPVDSSGYRGRLICTWRGRSVISGLLKDPQNWFMSKSGDPFDWEYSPDPVTVTDAVAGNNSPLGLIGDVITALIPYSDDLLIFGGDHTIYAMKGDPANNGTIDLVSDITGIAFGEAWCKDPYGNVYFFGSRPSVWKMAPGAMPQRISQAIEPLLEDINTGTNVIRLAWDDEQQAVHVFVTAASAQGATTHYVWEARSNAWWTDVYASTAHNPVSVCVFDGNESDDRAVLLGGWDGYVRAIDPDATTDDGTSIASSVLIGPIMTQDFDTMLLKELQFVLAETSGAISWEVLAADTAEGAVAAAARASGTAAAGRNGTQPIRVADHAIYVKISATTRWAMECVRAKFGPRGKVRQRKP